MEVQSKIAGALLAAMLSAVFGCTAQQPHDVVEASPLSSKESFAPEKLASVADSVALWDIKVGEGFKEAFSGLDLEQRDNTVVSLIVTKLPAESVFAAKTANAGRLEVPIQAGRAIVLQLQPGITKNELQDLLTKYHLHPVQVLAPLGVLTVQTNEDWIDEMSKSVATTSELDELDISKLIQILRSDSRVVEASPDSVLSISTMEGAVTPKAKVPLSQASGEREDWGISNAHISEVWSQLTVPVTVGVVDIGFSDHVDLQLRKALPVEAPPDNHGTHVAGILCAKHNDIGVRGVLPNCTVAYSAARSVLTDGHAVEGNGVVAWSALFSEYLATVFDFIEKNPDVDVVNLSLSYNWLPKFGKDPRSDQSMRNIVRSQGRIYLSLLEYAASKGVALVSAAGNDSTSLARPLDSTLASPFNFGAKLMVDVDGWSNGLIVEAHASNDSRARFSNVNGDISCPGDDILSTVAVPKDGIGTLSGTSMAAPYCAAALVAVRKIFPKLSLKDAISCIKRTDTVVAGVPHLNLRFALDHCIEASGKKSTPQRNAYVGRAAKELATGHSGFASSTVSTVHTCRYGKRRAFSVGEVADLGDGAGPDIVDASLRRDVQRFIQELHAAQCDEPILVGFRLEHSEEGYTEESIRREDFALVLVNAIRESGYPGGVGILEWPQFGQPERFPAMNSQVVVFVGDADLVTALLGTEHR